MAGEQRSDAALANAKPSILHVGGVGTNALINCNLLVERGYVSHVAANDIYHCICTPEWQELASKGLKREELGDDFFPNFFRIAESASVRQRWFAQGPQIQTILYLHMQRSGDLPAADIAWRTLQYLRFKAALGRTTVPGSLRLDEKAFASALRDMHVAPVFLDDLSAAFGADLLIKRFCELAARLSGGIDPASIVPPFERSYIDAIAAYDDHLADDIAVCRRVGLATLIGFEMPDWDAMMAIRSGGPTRPPERALARQAGVDPVDRALFASVLPAWNALFDLYDLRMTYGGSAVLGLLSDSPAYMTYEHGTIRSIPFEDNPIGRLTRRAYEEADAVFITNTDYVTASRRIEFSPEKRTYVPHAFDERPLIAFAEVHRPSERQDGPIRLFGPARQDWLLNDPARSKANHLVVEAAAQLVASGETGFHITFVAWGDDVEATKRLIADRNVHAQFSWIDPLARAALWQRYLDSDAVLDQFLLSGLSGVTYETLTLGVRTITKDDGICNKEFFGVPPPFMHAGTAEEIAARIRQLIEDPSDTAGIGRASQDWVKRHHSGARFVALQEPHFERLTKVNAAWLAERASQCQQPLAATASAAERGTVWSKIADYLRWNAKNSALPGTAIRSIRR